MTEIKMKPKIPERTTTNGKNTSSGKEEDFESGSALLVPVESTPSYSDCNPSKDTKFWYVPPTALPDQFMASRKYYIFNI